MAHICIVNVILFVEQNKIKNFTGTWLELGTTALNEVTQMQKKQMFLAIGDS